MKDSTLFRILFVFTTLFLGGGILLYLIMWLVVPRKPNELKEGE
ncbi:MAG: PspC domain-containing protein [Candidatus Omnitrophica bacterium]|nr:PspC domain-containing protein [Candidatus Omnitrophota bacterium]